MELGEDGLHSNRRVEASQSKKRIELDGAVGVGLYNDRKALRVGRNRRPELGELDNRLEVVRIRDLKRIQQPPQPHRAKL